MKNVIDIDGSKLKSLLTEKTGKSLKELSLENGFSDSFLRMVIKSGKASPTAQAVIKLYERVRIKTRDSRRAGDRR